MRRRQLPKWQRKRLIVLVTSCITFMLVAFTVQGIRLFDMLHSFHESRVIKSHHNLTQQPVSTFLLMGLDNSGKRKLSTTRTDGMMVVIVNHKTKTMTLCSLLRDTFVKIHSQQYHGYQRIGSAYTYGGDAAAIATVEHYLNLPIDYYLTVNWDGFIRAIDDIGPVEVNVDRDFIGQDYWGKPEKFKAGLQSMSGARALAYARERHIDNDQHRGFRQQAVFYAMVKRLNQEGLSSKGAKVVGDLKDQMRTNLTNHDMLTLFKSRKTFKRYRVKRLTFQWRTFYVAGRSMVEVYPDSRVQVSRQLQAAAGLRPDLPSQTFTTNGHYRYASDESVESKADEAKADTHYGQSHVYVGHAGNTTIGKLPAAVPLKNGFRVSDRTETMYTVH